MLLFIWDYLFYKEHKLKLAKILLKNFISLKYY